MIKLVVIDVDGAFEPSVCLLPEAVLQLKSLEEKGIRFCMVSHDSVHYVQNLASNLCLSNPLIVADINPNHSVVPESNPLNGKGYAINQIRIQLGIEKNECVVISKNNEHSIFEESFYAVALQQNNAHYRVEKTEDSFSIIEQLLAENFLCPRCKQSQFNRWKLSHPDRMLGECTKCEHTSDLANFIDTPYKHLT